MILTLFEIAAPGVAVNSTIINNAYASWDGTSMATAEDIGSAGRDNYYGYGLVQAKDMYDALANGCDVTTPPPSGDTYSNNTEVNIANRSTVTRAIDVTRNGASGSITVDGDSASEHWWFF